MTERSFDLCVIGAGSGGLSTAYAASHMGARVALIEGHKMGGDCLNYGCVPSKALLAAGHAAHAMRHAGPFGVKAVEPEIDFAAVNRHVREAIATIEPNDSVERYQGFGVEVIAATARFTGRDRLEAAGRQIRARRFVVATGSRAAVPPIPGLDRVPFFTNETLFDNTERPQRLLILGGGPIGCEMAQAHRRLGCGVTVFDRGTILPKDDPELVATVRESLLADGVELVEHAAIRGVAGTAGRIEVAFEKDGKAHRSEGTHLLVAAGRRPMWRGWGWRRPAWSMIGAASGWIPACAPRIGASSPSAIAPAASSSPISPTITPASSSATRCCACRRRWT